MTNRPSTGTPLSGPQSLADLQNSSRYINIDGMNIHVVESGSGEPLILLHGFDSCFYTWRYNISSLAEHFRVFAIDLPGFGFSDRPKEFSYTIRGFVRFLKRFADQMKLDKLQLIGHSLGGAICLEFSRRYEHLVEKMVLLSSTIPGETKVSENIMANLLLYTYYDKTFINSELLQMIKLVNSRKTSGALRRALMSGDGAIDLSAGNPKLHIPCLIVWGEEDRIILKENAFDLQKSFKNAIIHTISGCGHAPHEEKNSEFNERVIDFLNGGIN